MSNYWNLHCKNCNSFSETDINHGNDRLRGIAKLFPYIKKVLEVDEDEEYIKISVAGGYSTELFSFLREHDGHEIDIADENGHFEPIEMQKENNHEPV